jgi:hypothetical protein
VRGQLLEVVEDHQATAAAGDGMADLQHRIAPADRHVEGAGDGEAEAVDRSRLDEVAEVDAAGPVAQPESAVARHQPRLADAAGADDGDEGVPGIEAARELVELAVAADEGIALGGQVVRDPAGRSPAGAVGDDAIGLSPHRPAAPGRGRRLAISRISIGSPMPFSR